MAEKASVRLDIENAGAIQAYLKISNRHRKEEL